MPEEFVGYKKFADLESARQIAHLFDAAGIEYHLQDNNQHYVKVVGYQQIDLAITINLKSEDFIKADRVLETYYAHDIADVDKEYYLFEFSEEELKEVVLNPYDWGAFDISLAKKLLKEKGIEYEDSYIEKRKADTIAALSKMKKVPLYQLVLGYLFSVIIPFVGIIMGLLIMNNRTILPTGEKVYVHPESDRKHAQVMMILCIAWTCFIIISAARNQGRL